MKVTIFSLKLANNMIQPKCKDYIWSMRYISFSRFEKIFLLITRSTYKEFHRSPDADYSFLS